jgi:hypothetical protein
MSWDTARKLLAGSVVKSLGEELVLSDAGPVSATLRGVLVTPEQLQRLGAAEVIAGDARLTMRKSDAPAWLARGTNVTTAPGAEYQVTSITDNGEGVLEVMLCRL